MLLFSNPVFGGAGWLVEGGCNQPPEACKQPKLQVRQADGAAALRGATMSAQADGGGTSDGLADQAARPVMDSAPCLSSPCLARPPTANRASRWRLKGCCAQTSL